MTGCILADFELTIRGERAPYLVTARYGSSTANGDFAPSINDAYWQQAYRTLAQSMLTPDADAVMAVGSRLWRALMQGSVRDLWIAARADIEQQRVDGLRLRLDLQPTAVAALPWESLYDPDRNVILAAHPHYALVRVATIYQHVLPWRPVQVTLPITILVAAADDPTGAINSEREIAELCQITNRLGSTYVQVETLVGRFTIAELGKKLAQVKPAILHFIGHGEPAGLWLWQHGRATLTPAQSLRAVMERAPSVKLAFLNSCLAARPAGSHPFAGVATQILQTGVPAIIAMQYAIRDGAAIDFAHLLYEELIGGACPGVIDLAMSAARSGLYAANPGNFSFGAPVLWLNSNDGCIFSFTAPPVEEAATGEEPQTTPAPQPPTLDLGAENEWLEATVTATDVDHLPANLYFLHSQWLDLVKEARDLLCQLEVLVRQPASTAYTNKATEYERCKLKVKRMKRLIDNANQKS